MVVAVPCMHFCRIYTWECMTEPQYTYMSRSSRDCQFSIVDATPVEIPAYKQNKNSYNLLIAYFFPRTIRPSQLLPEVSIIVLTWNLRKPRGTEDMTGTKSWVVIALGYLRHNSHALFSLRSSECASVDDFLGVISILMHKWHLYKHQEKESHMPGIANSSASWTKADAVI